MASAATLISAVLPPSAGDKQAVPLGHSALVLQSGTLGAAQLLEQWAMAVSSESN